MKMVKILAALLALCLLLAGCGAGETAPQVPSAPAAPEKAQIPQDNLGFRVAQTMADFTFTTCSGEAVNLYETLAEKELVVLNFWASWCSPCAMEFPALEQAYGQLKEDIEVFALSIEGTDTDAVLTDYAAKMGMSFPVGRADMSLIQGFDITSVPTTVLVDRSGSICAIESGAVTDPEMFLDMFRPYLGPDYDGFMPPEHLYCLVEHDTPEDLAKALGTEDGSIVFNNVDDHYVWPFVVAEHEGRSVAVSSNKGFGNTSSVLQAQVKAQAGQVLYIDFALSTEVACDGMQILLDGVHVKGFARDCGYGGYAIALEEAGTYALEIRYNKDTYADGGEDCLRLDTVKLLSGQEAADALENNPVSLHQEETTMVPLTEGCRQILLDDPKELLLPAGAEEHFSFWLVPEDRVELRVTVDETVDVDYTVVTSTADYSTQLLYGSEDQDGYRFTMTLDSIAGTGYAGTIIDMMPIGASDAMKSVMFFVTEEEADQVLNRTDAQGQLLASWRYADGSPRENPYKPAIVAYTVACVDEQGKPVAGAMVQICDDTLCQVYTSDEKGLCSFTLPPYAYEAHILAAPAGYACESDVTALPEEGGSVKFVFKKNG